MSSSIRNLEKKIETLESEIDALRKRCHDLEWRMVRLAVAKIPDPRYPYWNWILSGAIPEETMVTLNLLLSALNERLTGVEIPNEEQKDIEGVSRDVLYGSGPLRVEDVLEAIKSITGMEDNWQVVDLIRAVNEQGMFDELCEHVLSSLYVASLRERDIG